MRTPSPRAAATFPPGLLLLFAAGLLTCARAPKTPPLATLAEWSGPVFVLRTGERAQAAPAMDLFKEDVLETGPAARAVIRYQDGTVVEAEENTRLRLEDLGGRLGLRIEAGQLLSRGPRGEAGSGRIGLRILTPAGSAEVLPGSEVRFALPPGGQTTIGVVYGTAELLDANGAPVQILEGETLAMALARRQADAGPPEPVEALVFRLSAGAGQARAKRTADGALEALGAAPVDLASGAEFQVSLGARARLEGGGLTAFLSGGSGKLHRAVRQGGSAQVVLELEGEPVDLSLTAPQRLELRHAQSAALTLETSEPSLLRYSQTARGARVDVRLGQVELVTAAGRQTVAAGQALDIEGATAALGTSKAPLLVLPNGRRAQVYAEGLLEVGLELPSGARPVRLELAADEQFTQPLGGGRLGGEVATAPVPEGRQLYWRFLDDAGQAVGQGLARFDRDSGRSTLDETHPRAEVNETGLKATIYFQAAPPALRFNFAAQPGAKKYRLRIFPAGKLDRALVEREVPTNTCLVEPGKVPEGEYLWYASPLDGAGNELAGGRMNRLRLTYDNTRPTLAVARPKPNERVTEPVVQTRGVAPMGAKVFVNGEPVALDRRGRFAHRTAAGDAVVFRMVSPTGEESFWVRQLRREP